VCNNGACGFCGAGTTVDPSTGECKCTDPTQLLVNVNGHQECQACQSGQTACNGQCVDSSSFQSDPANCGSCGHACSSGETCSDGTCQQSQCSSGLTACGNPPVCSNLKTDNNNCGSCGNQCPLGGDGLQGQVCSNGVCTPCPPGKTRCGDTCVDTANDNNNCGACGTSCSLAPFPAGAVCQGSQCQCPISFNGSPAQTACDGQCVVPSVAFKTDSNNCGACGHVCPSDETCSGEFLSADGPIGLCCPPGQIACEDPVLIGHPSCADPQHTQIINGICHIIP
jgi:hypothetical protein